MHHRGVSLIMIKLKNPPVDRDGRPVYVIAAYETFIRGDVVQHSDKDVLQAYRDRKPPTKTA